ncbi:MAG: alpha-L-fucosidase [Oscillospiraceae bacterium]|nr:alpha-L-fucosidase [Oscillospiraceae bacterium]
MNFFKRFNDALHSRIGAYVFFALAAVAFAMFYGSEHAHKWMPEVYPLGEKFVPTLLWVIGICAAAALIFLVTTEKIQKRALRVIQTMVCVLSGILFGYTFFVAFSLDLGFDYIQRGLEVLSAHLPLLAIALALPLPFAIFANPKKQFIGVVSAAVISCLAVSIVFCVTYIKTDGGFAKNGWHQKSLPENAEVMISVLPSERQIAHAEETEFAAFIHFGINTFTGREWGSGTEDPALFNPTNLDTDQWAKAMADAGMKGAILTAKHHDGFALWQTEHSEFSIKNSPYKNGKGDIAKEFADSCRKYGLKVGFYLSPWDLHEPTYGSDAYNDFYKAQLRELLTNYGEVSFVWFDGAANEDGYEYGRGRKQEYDWDGIVALVRELQPGAVTAIAPPVPDVAWVGNEDGLANGNVRSVRYRSDQWIWAKSECDVSIRHGWFYNEHEEPKSLEHLMYIYYNSVGMNCTLLLNVPPNKEGLFDEKDVARLSEMGKAIEAIYENKIPTEMSALSEDGDIYALDCKLDSPQKIENVVFSEDAHNFSERVMKFSVYAKIGGLYLKVGESEAAGWKSIVKLDKWLTPKTDSYRILIEEARGNPAVREIGFYN